MYEIAGQVARWLEAGRPVLLARVLDTVGISSREPAAAVAYSPGQALAGSLFSGAADAALATRLASVTGPCLLTIEISEPAAAGAGLSCGGSARLLVQPVGPELAWHRLVAGEPVLLSTELDGDSVGASRCSGLDELPRSAPADDRAAELARLLRRGTSQTCLLRSPELVVTALWPTVRVFVVGDGLIADALVANASLLGWRASVHPSLPAGLLPGAADCVVVLDHDLAVSGSALAAALAAGTGYVGALGSRRTQAARAGWLAEHGVGEQAIGRIHGPAGLPIGSQTPAEIALSIIAEIVQVRSHAG
ncbi:MAG: XdhC family protein [Jatrophihabitans sp.]